MCAALERTLRSALFSVRLRLCVLDTNTCKPSTLASRGTQNISYSIPLKPSNPWFMTNVKTNHHICYLILSQSWKRAAHLLLGDWVLKLFIL